MMVWGTMADRCAASVQQQAMMSVGAIGGAKGHQGAAAATATATAGS